MTEDKTRDLEKMQGCCICCGQIQFVMPVVADPTEEQLNHMATMKCNCSGAKEYQELQASKIRAKDNIRKLVGNDELITLMTAAVDVVADGTVEKISITDYNDIRYALRKTGAGKIRVEKAKTNKEALE